MEGMPDFLMLEKNDDMQRRVTINVPKKANVLNQKINLDKNLLTESYRRTATTPQKSEDREGQAFEIQFIRPNQVKVNQSNNASLTILNNFGEPSVPVGFVVRQGFN